MVHMIEADNTLWTREKQDEYIRGLRVHNRKLETENQKLRDMLSRYVSLTEIASSVAVDCMMCDKGTPPRKAVTSVADIPACEQCAKEYQDAEDALGAQE